MTCQNSKKASRNFGATALSHPIHMLNGDAGTAPKYNNSQCTLGNSTSAYVYNTDALDQIPSNWTINFLDRNSNQKMPLGMAQINDNRKLRARIYGAIAHGAKGMGFWRDYSANRLSYGGTTASDYDPNFDMLNNPEYLDIKNIINEITAMKDLIKQPHWTCGWKIKNCDVTSGKCIDQNVVFGTRELNGEGYVFLSNYDNTARNVTIELENLPYSFSSVKDLISGQTIASTSGTKFTWNLGINKAAVIQLIKPTTLSTNETSNLENDIKLYPNPSSNGLFYLMNSMKQTITTIKIIDASGKLLETYEESILPSGKFAIKTEGYISGVYFVNIIMEDGSQIIEKLIIK